VCTAPSWSALLANKLKSSALIEEDLQVPSNEVPPPRVVIAIDPHKASWTAAAVDAALAPLATLRTPVNREGYRQLRGFAARWPGAV